MYIVYMSHYCVQNDLEFSSVNEIKILDNKNTLNKGNFTPF